MRNGFLVGGTRDRLTARLFPAVEGRLQQTGGLSVLRQDLRRCIALLLENLEELSMEILAPAFQQALIGGVAHQRVLEQVGGLGCRTAAEDELRLDKSAYGRCQLRLGSEDNAAIVR